jgi:glycosyltransferase involved in cell wall biosynthesis
MKRKNLEDTTLTLFFTGGVGLKTWADVGNLDREVEIYKRLSHNLKRVSFITYGGSQDRVFSGKLDGINVLPVKWHRRRTFTMLDMLLRYWQDILQTDILKTNQIPGSDIAVWLKRRLRKRLIVRCGYLHSFFVKRATQDARVIQQAIQLEKNAFTAADMGIVTSAWQRDIVIQDYGIDPSRIRVIPNYVVTDVFRPHPDVEKKYDLVFVGRAGKEKNTDNLLEALRDLKSRGRSYSLLMIGGCCQDQRLRDTASRHSLDITFAGSVPNFELPARLNQARVFIQPSLYEGHPKTLLEAMSCGLPCIASDVTGIREDVQHGTTGYLCRTDHRDIASALETVLSDAALRERLGHNAREYILESYSLDRVFQMEMDVIREVMAR